MVRLKDTVTLSVLESTEILQSVPLRVINGNSKQFKQAIKVERINKLITFLTCQETTRGI